MPTPHLLLVEDDNTLRYALERKLTGSFRVTAHSSAAHAAATIGQVTYDCVLSDINMPGMSGLELLRHVREHDLDVPVVLMTGEPSVDTALAALELGALMYLHKPLLPDIVEAGLLHATKLSRFARFRRELADAGLGSPLGGDRVGIETRLDRALESLFLVFQPIADQKTRRTMGYEALMRSAEPSMPHPGAILEAAERLGRLHELGRRVRNLAAQSLTSLDRDLSLFVNLHASDLDDPTLHEPTSPLSAHASRVVLEITERAAIERIADTKQHARSLRALGFRLAVDDLGAGYAGLTSFATFEPEIVKLDMSLIRGIHESVIKQRIVRSVVEMSQDLRAQVVAEGVETAEELEGVCDLGCDLVQGFLLGRPDRDLKLALL